VADFLLAKAYAYTTAAIWGSYAMHNKITEKILMELFLAAIHPYSDIFHND
jgi:hypothetical protein